jgi:hypothetical protein
MAVYAGVKDGQPSRDVVPVTHRVRRIRAIPCAVVEDRLYLHGRLRGRTTTGAARRVTSTDGTWTAGVDGARAGIYMPAHPRLGQSGGQESYPGHAEDQFKVIGLFRAATGAAADNALLTGEWTPPLEPRMLDHKLYVRGIVVLEHTERGADEHAELVALSHS